MSDIITHNNERKAEETDQGSETDYMSIPAGPSGEAKRGEGEDRPRPGPASSKVRYQTRSRSGSASSVSSISSNASTAIMAERRSRREAAQEVNRLAMQMGREQGGGSPIISVDSDESDEEIQSREKRRPCKRKLSEGNEEETVEEDVKRKQGRPQTTGLYVKRAEAMDKLNQLKREAAELDNEKMIKGLSSGQIFANLERDLEDAVEELSDAPTADVACQARECMAGVLKVTKCSKNLQGGMRKILNHAAVRGAASTEVLRTRADSSGSDREAARQIKELRRELEKIRLEAQSAKEEAIRANEESERLRQELAEMRIERETRRQRRVLLDESPPSSPDRGKKEERVAQAADATENAPSLPEKVAETPMEVEIATEEAAQEKPPKYSDERRKKEILPPPEEWPAAVRPALQGRVKILEDRPLNGHKVRLVEGKTKRTKKVEPSPVAEAEKEPRGGAQLLLEQLTPLLQKWLEDNLSSMGLVGKPSDKKADATTAKRQSGVGQNNGQKAVKTTRPQTKGPDTAKAEVIQSTTVPNTALWSKVVGRKATKKKQPTAEETAGRQAGGKNAQTTRRMKGSGKVLGNGKEGSNPRRGLPRKRPPRTAAVTLTCPPDQYARAMRTAREKINLEDLGINVIKPRRAATGGLVLEIPGPDGKEKAISLREKMEEALREMEGVRVRRPEKMMDMRIKDLLDSTEEREIAEAVAKEGGCTPEEVKVGAVRKSSYGLCTSWVQCPVRVANKVAAAGKIRIGWTASRVEALESRQPQCFRCLERGHVQNNCTSQTDRRSLCYRCGQDGHLARNCANPPQCVICKEAGRPSTHRMGGAACKAPRKKPSAKESGNRDKPKPGSSGSSSSQMEMDVEEYRPAVRGGPTLNGSTPVPVRPAQKDGEEKMEVDSTQPPPKEQRVPRTRKGLEEPDNKA